MRGANVKFFSWQSCSIIFFFLSVLFQRFCVIVERSFPAIDRDDPRRVLSRDTIARATI